METKELISVLEEKGFQEEEKDTGINFVYNDGHIKLICYIEPEVEVEFISIYKWNNNDVKGTYNIPVKELRFTNDSIAVMFRKTKNNLPQYVGLEVDTHLELEFVIEKIFD